MEKCEKYFPFLFSFTMQAYDIITFPVKRKILNRDAPDEVNEDMKKYLKFLSPIYICPLPSHLTYIVYGTVTGTACRNM